MRQLSSDDYMMSSISLNQAATTSIPSVQWGKDWVNIGFGGELIQSQNFRLFADYDLDLGKNSTSHLGSLSAVLMW
jgi:hypothetical protein